MTSETVTDTAPRVYVASLADYNAGRLHGQWLNLAEYEDVDDMWRAVAAMLDRSRELVAEEWAIHDYEGFGPIRIGEYENLEAVWGLARDIAAEGDAIIGYVDNVGLGYYDPDDFQNAYEGCWRSVRGYVEETVDDVYLSELRRVTTPEHAWRPNYSGTIDAVEYLVQFIDYDRIEREWFDFGDMWAYVTGDGAHIYRGV